MYVGMDEITAIRLASEKIVNELGLYGAEIEISREEESFRVSIVKDGECNCVFWIEPETGRVWGFTIEGNMPQRTIEMNLNNLVNVLRKLE